MHAATDGCGRRDRAAAVGDGVRGQQLANTTGTGAVDTLFNTLDTNNNSLIDPDEIHAYVPQHRSIRA